MWIQTHSYMASQIHKYIKEKYQLELCFDILQHSSIKPDLHWKYLNISHYYEEGYDFWLEEVEQLLKNCKYQSIDDFSDKLGVILHFTADFFCSAHNDQKLKRNMWQHLLYEIKLHLAFMKYKKFQNFCLLSSEDASSILYRLRNKYFSSNPDIENDIFYIYSASLSISDFIIKSMLIPTAKVS